MGVPDLNLVKKKQFEYDKGYNKITCGQRDTVDSICADDSLIALLESSMRTVLRERVFVLTICIFISLRVIRKYLNFSDLHNL